jgi:hypothetical protein
MLFILCNGVIVFKLKHYLSNHVCYKMSHSILQKCLHVEKDDALKRSRLYNLCVPVRIGFAVFVSFFSELVLLIPLLYAMAFGFFRAWWKQTAEDRGAFQGRVWWKRSVHAVLFFSAATTALFEIVYEVDLRLYVLLILLFDVGFGVVHRLLRDKNCDGNISMKKARMMPNNGNSYELQPSYN